MPHPLGGYKLKNGEKVPGVTTIIGRFKKADALLFWACEQGKAIERGEIFALYDKRAAAAEAGTLAHSLVEAHINGLPLPEMPDNKVGKQALQGYQNYIRWQEDNRIQVIKQEMKMVSEVYRFGGCPDATGIDSQGRHCLLDWKTSATGPYVDWLLQLAAYKILWQDNYPDKPINGGFHLLKFSKESADFSHFYWEKLDDAEKMFLLFCEAYRLDRVLKKRL